MKDKQEFKIVFDNGKPYEIKVYGETELKNELKEFYLKNKTSEYPFDAKVYTLDSNNEEIDISEGQFIGELIADILEVQK